MSTVNEYQLIADQSGLRNIRVWGDNAEPLMSFDDEGDKEAFRNFVMRRMIDETKQNNGRYFETFRRIYVSAEGERMPKQATRPDKPV